MASIFDWWLKKSRRLRSALLGPFAKGLVKLGVKANHVTALSLACGAAAAFFLFRDRTIFITLIVLHLVFDALDGVVARADRKNKDGEFIDYMSDRLVTLILLSAAFLNLWNQIIIAAIVLKLVHHLIFVFSRFRTPVLYSRTFFALFYVFGFYNLGALFVVVTNALGIILQVHHLVFLRLR